MVARLDGALLETVLGAGHDVHLDRPAEWRSIVERFLDPEGRQSHPWEGLRPQARELR